MDSWLQRGKLKFQDYSSLIDDLEDWWNLEEAFLRLSKISLTQSPDLIEKLKKNINVI